MLREEFHAINSGPGTLCNAGNICGLCNKIVRLGQLDQPLGKNAAALPAECEYCYGDRSVFIARDHHALRNRRLSARF